MKTKLFFIVFGISFFLFSSVFGWSNADAEEMPSGIVIASAVDIFGEPVSVEKPVKKDATSDIDVKGKSDDSIFGASVSPTSIDDESSDVKSWRSR